MKRLLTLGVVSLLLFAASPLPVLDAQTLTLKKGAHICIIGNTLGERMQHTGWLETLLQSRFPEHELVIRNLAFSADELNVRLRSMDFGSPDQWLAGSAPIPNPDSIGDKNAVRQNRFELTNTQADVIFAFFGYNESFAGEAGLENFKQQLDAQLKHMASQKYNGKSPPRIVLFSPIAHENLNNRNLPDGSANNQRLQLYTSAMYEVAKGNGVAFVDLFAASQRLYEKNDKPLTINGIHINELGDKLLAAVADQTLFTGQPAPQRNAGALEKIRAAVMDKNFYWFHRYRTTDGYSTYGARAFLKFTNGQTNYEVAQRELEVLDVMTANRDKKIWAVAQGKELSVDDANTPPFVPVPTNKPGPGPNGAHVFLTGEEGISKFTLGKNLKANLFASEEQFPELVNPVQMAFDTKGRLWVAAWPTYPHWKPKVEQMADKLLILEDTDGDGRADKCKTFAANLHNPTGFEFWGGGVLVAMAPDILFLKDTDGDDKADVYERVLHGLDSADTHHTANSFTLDPGGSLYFQEGVFHHTQAETPWGPPTRLVNAGVFRFEPRTSKFDVYVSYGFANPHGHAFDRWGQDFVVDGTGANPYHATIFSGHTDFPRKHTHSQMPQLYQQRTRPCPAIETLSSRHFPDEMQGNLLVGNVIGFHGILRYKMTDKEASFLGVEDEPVIFSSDQNFRPADIEVGPDGAIYVTDWQNPIIGHMQHNLRDPSRDKTHGRVYRITYEGRPLMQPPKIAGEPIERLLEILKEPEDRVRYRARIELSARDSDQVVAAAKKWAVALDVKDPNVEHHLTEALWLHQSHNVVDEALLKRMLRSSEPKARAAATRVLWHWRDRVSNVFALLAPQADDPHPLVRLEAVRACSYFRDVRAAEVALLSLKHPSDQYLAYTLNETMTQLEPFWKKAINDGQSFAADNPAGIDFLLRSVSTAELVKMPRTALVFQAMLSRPQVPPDFRQEALNGLAKLNNSDLLVELLNAIERLDKAEGATEPSLADLGHLLFGHGGASAPGHDHHDLSEHLKHARDRLAKMSADAKRPFVRQLMNVALITADGSVEPTWKEATASVRKLTDWLQSVPLIPDAKLRATAHNHVQPLLFNLPPALAEQVKNNKGSTGRYVRIELPRKGVLTLAEVQVFSDGMNVAPSGTAKQSSTGYGGDAKRAIDGRTDGVYGAGSSTHTSDNDGNPWWEVDLGTERSVEAVAVWNRTEGDLGNRLEGFTITVLDAARKPVWEKAGIAAPKENIRFALDGDPAGSLRRTAINAIVTTGKDEAATFSILAKFIREGVERPTAVRAISRLPAATWPQAELPPLVAAIIADVSKLSTEERTSPTVRDALQLANDVAARLPSKSAQAARKTLRELGVPVVVVRPVPHQIIYDKSHLYVEAGKPVELVFENIDIMPHNLVIARPGTLEKVGIEGEKMAADPNAFAKNFVPTIPQVLFATRLLQPQQTDRVTFTAPTELGEYPYVCTFPGHWRRMTGTLHVVKSLDDVSPEELAAATTTQSTGPTRQFVREWTTTDLQPSLAQLHQSRNAERGKELFKQLTCVQCHKLGGQGGQVGPDLAETAARIREGKMSRSELVAEVIEPSKKIDEKFRTHVIELTNGKVVSGLIVHQTDKELHIRSSPLDQKPGTESQESKPTVVRVEEIEERFPSKVSLMPQGLLNTLTQEEILDLLGYVLSGGK